MMRVILRMNTAGISEILPVVVVVVIVTVTMVSWRLNA